MNSASTMLRQLPLQKGQALLVIVLIMVVALTVGLSVATRSITNSRVTKEEDDSQRAFSAAEAGVEQLLKSGDTSIPETSIGQATTYNATVINQQGNDYEFNNGNSVQKDIGVDFWLSEYPDYTSPVINGNYTLYWGEGTSCATNPPTAAAIEVVVLQGASKSNPDSTHFAFDPCPLRRAQNNFSATGAGNGTYQYSGTFSVTNGFIARIIPLYNSTRILVNGAPMRVQGKMVESTGSSGGTVRKVSVFQSYPSLPIEIFPNVIFSPQ